MGNLAPRFCSTAGPGAYGDGDGLWFRVKPSKRASRHFRKTWAFRYTWQGKVTEIGLGRYPEISLAEARERALEGRRLVARGIYPAEARKAARAAAKAPEAPTFGHAATEVLAAKASAWRSASHSVHWINSVRTYAETIWDQPVDTITDATAREIVLQLWKAIPKTAPRVRARFEAIMDYAKAHDWYTGENPFRLKGNLKPILPGKKRLEREHFGALDYQALPEFLAGLRQDPTIAHLCLEFQTITTTRPSEARCAIWTEIDPDQKLWIIPANRMKAGVEHIVPLSARALQVLNQLPRSSALLFPGRDPRRPISPPQISRLLPAGATAHGMRSCFRDWCLEQQPSRGSLPN